MDPATAPSPRNSSNTDLLRKLSVLVTNHARSATFACGGSVDYPMDTGSEGPGVIIRWDGKDGGEVHKTSFPPCAAEGTNNDKGIEALVQRCEPATFGQGDRDVLDEGYRNAGKLDPEAFSTGFYPHDVGILDVVGRVLMPGVVGGGGDRGRGEVRGVRAELYMLNIYSAPAGRFLTHVDTPHGENQFGSLVVGLPCWHEGGTLRVKHLGQTVDFAWASQDPKSIQWAAFYGDCEHEVLEVTAGHRVTLTYNLYYTPLGDLALPMSDPTKLPLYDTIAQILREPNFMRKGGWLGFFCHHAYAHSTEAHRKLIPGVFKGVDLAVFSAFSRLGLAASVHPILHKRGSWLYDEDIKNEWGGLSAKELLQGSVSEGNTTGDFVEWYFEAVDRRYQEMVDHGEEDDSDYDDVEGYEDKQWCKEEMSIVGSEMHGPIHNPQEDNELDREGVIADWIHQKMRKIVWMNEPRHEDFACAGLAYGNQASLDFKFSAAAILVPIPTSRFRGLNVESGAGVGKSERGEKRSGPIDSPRATSGVIDLTEES